MCIRDSYEIGDVDKQPDKPCGRAGQVQFMKIGNAGQASDDGQAPFVKVMERLHRLILQTPDDGFRNIGPRLNRRLRHAG